MFVALSRFEVRNGMADDVHRAFQERPQLVEQAAGFVRLDVLRPMDTPAEFWLMTYWTDQDSYETWHASHARKASHDSIPAGLRLVPGATTMTYLTHVAS